MCNRHLQTNLPKTEQDCELEKLLSHRDQLLHAKVPQYISPQLQIPAPEDSFLTAKNIPGHIKQSYS